MTSKLVVNTIEADTGISSVSFASSISMNSTAKFHFSAAGIDIGADTNINRPASGVLGFNINSSEKVRIDSSGNMGQGTATPTTPDGSNADNPNNGKVFTIYGDSPAINLIHNTAGGGSAGSTDYAAINFGRNGSSSNPYRAVIGYKQVEDILHINANNHIVFDTGGNINTGERLRITSDGKIGINDTAPERTMDVRGSNCMIQLEGTGGSGKQWSLCSADNTTGAAVGTAGMFAIYNDSDGVAALRISNSNYVLRPKLPYFNCTATPTAGSPAIHSFGNVHSNNGSHYDNSNGRFTAPVTGFYWFSCGIWCNAVASNGTHIQLMRYIQSSSSTTAFAGANHSDQYNNLNCSAGTYMESGDYVYIHQTNISVQSSTPRNFFSGYLVG